MTNEADPQPEDFAQLLARLKSEYGIGDSEVARRIDVSVSTVNTWVHRKRQPRREALEKLAHSFPKFSRSEIFAAADRETPGPLSADDKQEILELLADLTAEQQELQKIQIRAIAERNRSALS
ncbi:helix-turn-helix domain-containing protein [Streptomyces sp. NBC_01511]|uniref:XRE family transcriptional regulator n=1 Tax=Streptomyces sp. NBC_01511 TaxID=2903889 RepID=UPI00386F05DC